MLVAVGLIVLMMVLFATIFQLATGAMSTQKGLTENDQRVRLVVTMLRNDLGSTDKDPVTGTNIRAHRTFKCLIPFGAGETLAPINPQTPGTAAAQGDRSGYFYISEGNPNDDTDDNIQFTITVPSSSNDRIFGRAAILLADATGGYGPAGTAPSPPQAGYPPAAPAAAPLIPPPTAGFYYPNQPEFDDLLGTPNQVGSSTTAEVSWFLRNGTLYRRVMLVRVPNISPPPIDDHTPTDGALPLAMTPYTNGTRGFWADYDYSASFDNGASLPFFHGIGDLTNAGASTVSTFWTPYNRWGFDNTTNYLTGGGGYGLPREFDTSGNYIGRFTHAETSDVAFGYPARIPGTGNPMASGTTINLVNGAITQFPNGTRAGEDVIMTNVLAFDIKVWDPAASLGADGAPGIAGFDDDGINGTDDYGELGAYGSDDGDWRDIGHAGFTPPKPWAAPPGPLSVPLAPQQQPPYGFYCANACQNAYYSNSGTAVPTTNRYDTWGPSVEIDGLPANVDKPPYRPIYAGPDGKPGVANFNDDGINGVDDPGELGWPGSDDFAPLTAIKITIRFYDTTSKQIRDISVVYRLIWEK